MNMITKALGINIGDVLKTSYSDCRYEVKSISPPCRFTKNVMQIVIRDHEVISFVLRDLDHDSHTDSYINNVRRTGNAWATDQNDQIFVEKKSAGKIIQVGLFEAQQKSAPDYPFQADCDYRAGAGKVWHCPRCEKDFNSSEKNKLPFCCPVCVETRGRCFSTCVPIFYIAEPPIGDWRPRPSEAMMTLNFEDYLPYEKQINTSITAPV